MIHYVYTNLTHGDNPQYMPRVEPIKKHLLMKRAKIIKFLNTEGYSGEEIGVIFNIDRSGVSRILATAEKYKISAKNILKD